uniref:M20/M25/M40 family metallo-hydrolase n=1 Tax=Aminivibrio sp. TaxID=1872489 RepID=UPI00345EA9DD
KNRASLVSTFFGEKVERTIALIGQLDTHNILRVESWNYPPYRATFKDGFVYGRGTSNMKGGLASIILALQEVVRKKKRFPVNIILCLTADGELNGTGAKKIVEGGFLDNATELIFVEPTDGKIAIAQKGALWVKILTKGRACHTCYPENGIDAIEHLIGFHKILKRRVLSGQNSHPLLGNPLCMLTEINGSGSLPNFIPDRCEGVIDIRLLPSQGNAEILDEMSRIAVKMMSKVPGLSIERDVFVDRKPSTMPKNSPVVIRFVQILKELKMDTSLQGFHSFSDVSRIVPFLGLPFVIIGPGEDIVETTINERVSLSSVVDVAKVLLRYIESA